MGGFSTPGAAGITKLSELEIDASKDWAAKKVENIGAPDTDNDVPRRDTIDDKITTHTTPSAHHAKYTDAEVLLVAAALVHAARHQNGGADEISVAGLAGLLADDQNPTAHSATKITSGRLPSILRLPTLTTGKIWQGVAGVPAEGDVPAGGGLAIFGDGSDGEVTISENTDLVRDMFYNTLTVNNGITLSTKGYRIFVKGILTNNGTIERNGNNGGNATTYGMGIGGSALSAGSLGGSGAGGDGSESTDAGSSHGGGGGSGGGVCFIAAKTIINNNGTISANGGNGGNANGTGGASEFITPGSGDDITDSIGANGGAGGDGKGSGKAGGSAIPITAIQGSYKAPPFCVLTKDGTTQFSGGAGGGGGGWGHEVSNAGGGGGGGGGCLILVYNSLTPGIEQANGGSGGAKYGTGADGSPGSNGNVVKIVNV